MATEIKAPQVWFHSFGPAKNHCPESLTSCLVHEGLDIKLLEPTNIRGPGIVFLTEVTQEACEFVRIASKNGRERVLVLAPQEATEIEEDAWRIVKVGASDFLVLDESRVPSCAIVARFMRWQEIDELIRSPLVLNNLVGESRVWKSVISRIVEVARFTDAPVLLMGETGTGKELAARLIHTLDRHRNKGELVILDCSTIVPELSGSELFGHERGAFTGAVSARDGAFALADGGTLFLDEVGELPPSLQTKLLRALQEHTYKRVGSNTWHHTDFRLICATNRDIRPDKNRGRFRTDLYYRTAAWTITLPPLRDRIEDTLPLVAHFMRESRPDETPPDLDKHVKKYILTRDYPGNVRDLKNLVYRMMTSYVGGGLITIGNIPVEEQPEVAHCTRSWCSEAVEQAIRQGINNGAGLKEVRRTIEETAIRVVLEDEGGSLQRAAQKLGVTDRALQKRRAEDHKHIESIMHRMPGRHWNGTMQDQVASSG